MTGRYEVTENDLGLGCLEIGIRDAGSGKLVAVITRPVPGSKWFLHRFDSKLSSPIRGVPFKTRKEAIQSAVAGA